MTEREDRAKDVAHGDEPYEEADSGYPEREQPGAVPDDDPAGGDASAVESRNRPDTSGAPGDEHDGPATGNPKVD